MRKVLCGILTFMVLTCSLIPSYAEETNLQNEQ